MTPFFIAAVPSAISELAMYANMNRTTTPMRWAADVGNRVYTGGQYATNVALLTKDESLELMGRASLPRPVRYGAGPSGTPAQDAADPLGASATTGGDIDTASGTVTRYYRFAWAKEQAAVRINSAGDDSEPETDARNPVQRVPTGMFGPLSEAEVSVAVSGGNSAVEIDDVQWTVPEDYGITHAYVFASTGVSLEEDGIYRYVGKIAYDAGAGTWGSLLDTLASEVLLERAEHTGGFLTMPTFSAACRWGARFCGVAGGAQSLFSTANQKIKLSCTKGSRVCSIVDESGDPPGTSLDISEDAVVPRYWEHGGVFIEFNGVDAFYEVDLIEENDRTKFRLVTPFEGATGNYSFTAAGANALYIGYANLQQQEFAAPGYVLPGDDYFNGTITAVHETPRGDALLVFTRSAVYAVRGIPEVDGVQFVPEFTGSVRPVSLTEGCAGPYAVCDGPDNIVFALGPTGLYAVSTERVVDLTSHTLRDHLLRLTPEDMERAVLAFDYSRRLILATLGHMEGEPRPGGWSGADRYEQCLVFDYDQQSFTAWTGGRWRYAAVSEPTVLSQGAQVVFQDLEGDLVLMGDDLLADKQGTGALTASVVSVDGDVVELDASLGDSARGQYLVVASPGASQARLSRIVSVSGADVTVESGGGGLFAADDVVIAGGIVAEWQTGAVVASGGGFHSVRGVSYELESEDLPASFLMRSEVFSGGPANQLPPATQPSAKRWSTWAQVRTSKTQGMPRVKSSRRAGVGFLYVQPAGGDLTAAHRVRVNALEILDDTEPQRDGGS